MKNINSVDSCCIKPSSPQSRGHWKHLLVFLVFIPFLFAFYSCGKSEMEKLQERAAVLLKENYDLKDRLAAVDKERKELLGKVVPLTAERDKCQRDLKVLQKRTGDKTGEVNQTRSKKKKKR